MKTLINLLRLAIVTYWEQLYYRFHPTAQLRHELHEAHQNNAQLRKSISHHLTESVVMLAEMEQLEKRNAYLESLHRRRNDLMAASMMRLPTPAGATDKMTLTDDRGRTWL